MKQESEQLLSALPISDVGCLYLDPRTFRPVVPDPAAPSFSGLVRHFGSIGGAWPKVVT